ncbi:MAG: alpha-amylase family glycosyl hydrolase, partial [Candidatus Omnitrophota bacterium]
EKYGGYAGQAGDIQKEILLLFLRGKDSNQVQKEIEERFGIKERSFRHYIDGRQPQFSIECEYLSAVVGCELSELLNWSLYLVNKIGEPVLIDLPGRGPGLPRGIKWTHFLREMYYQFLACAAIKVFFEQTKADKPASKAFLDKTAGFSSFLFSIKFPGMIDREVGGKVGAEQTTVMRRRQRVAGVLDSYCENNGVLNKELFFQYALSRGGKDRINCSDKFAWAAAVMLFKIGDLKYDVLVDSMRDSNTPRRLFFSLVKRQIPPMDRSRVLNLLGDGFKKDRRFIRILREKLTVKSEPGMNLFWGAFAYFINAPPVRIILLAALIFVVYVLAKNISFNSAHLIQKTALSLGAVFAAFLIFPSVSFAVPFISQAVQGGFAYSMFSRLVFRAAVFLIAGLILLAAVTMEERRVKDAQPDYLIPKISSRKWKAKLEKLGGPIIDVSMEALLVELGENANQSAKGGLGILEGDSGEGYAKAGIKTFIIVPMYENRLIPETDLLEKRQRIKTVPVDYSKLIDTENKVDYHLLTDDKKLEYPELEINKQRPIKAVTDENGREIIIKVSLFDEKEKGENKFKDFDVAVYVISRGGTPAFLLACESINDVLYTENEAKRLMQQVLVGKAVPLLLKRLEIKPSILRLNEAHTIVALPAVRDDQYFKGISYVFTNHTPVTAGLQIYKNKKDWFARLDLPEQYRNIFVKENDLDFSRAAMILANIVNGVSEKHKHVLKQMFHEFAGEIHGIMNGSAEFWKSDNLIELERRKQGQKQEISAGDLWEVHEQDKQVMNELIYARTGRVLDLSLPVAIAVRRITAYKQQYPMLKDIIRALCQDRGVKTKLCVDGQYMELDGLGMAVVLGGIIVNENWQEMQDWIGAFISWMDDPAFKGRFIFISGNDVELMKKVAAGCDIWIEMPRPPEEACGTSGMRAFENGNVVVASLDGGPLEFIRQYDPQTGYGNGFFIKDNNQIGLYNALKTISDLYYSWRDKGDTKWIDLRKKIYQESPALYIENMVKRYVLELFLPIKLSKQVKNEFIRGPIYQINARVFGTIKDGSKFILGGIKYLEKQLPQIIKEYSKNIYLVGILAIGDVVDRMSRGERSDEDKNTPFYTVRDGASGKIRMFIRQEWQGEKDRQGSPFASCDPRAINPKWGTVDGLRRLARKYKNQGVRFFLDFIPNHIGLDNPWFIENENWKGVVHKIPADWQLERLSDKELLDLEIYNPFVWYEKEQCWVRQHRYFVFYRIPGDKTSRIMIAHGRDPNYDGWVDTVQLDYTKEITREYMKQTIRFWASQGISLRCDMSNLITRMEFQKNWYKNMSWQEFDRIWPAGEEFWCDVISDVLREYPEMILLLEAYGKSAENYLPLLHPRVFVYSMHLLDLWVKFLNNEADISAIKDYLIGTPQEILKKLVHFIQNHDEDPAVRLRFLEKAAAIFIATIPGIPFIYDLQANGYTRKLPIQKVVVEGEKEDADKQAFYAGLMKIASNPIFRFGGFYVLEPKNPHLLAYTRTSQEGRALVVINTSWKWQSGSIRLDWQLDSGRQYCLNDIYHHRKFDSHSGSEINEKGIYVELDPGDSHVFIIQDEQEYLKSQQEELEKRKGQLRFKMEEIIAARGAPVICLSDDMFVHGSSGGMMALPPEMRAVLEELVGLNPLLGINAGENMGVFGQQILAKICDKLPLSFLILFVGREIWVNMGEEYWKIPEDYDGDKAVAISKLASWLEMPLEDFIYIASFRFPERENCVLDQPLGAVIVVGEARGMKAGHKTGLLIKPYSLSPLWLGAQAAMGYLRECVGTMRGHAAKVGKTAGDKLQALRDKIREKITVTYLQGEPFEWNFEASKNSEIIEIEEGRPLRITSVKEHGFLFMGIEDGNGKWGHFMGMKPFKQTELSSGTREAVIDIAQINVFTICFHEGWIHKNYHIKRIKRQENKADNRGAGMGLCSLSFLRGGISFIFAAKLGIALLIIILLTRLVFAATSVNIPRAKKAFIMFDVPDYYRDDSLKQKQLETIAGTNRFLFMNKTDLFTFSLLNPGIVESDKG